jgi:hypothetical protein
MNINETLDNLIGNVVENDNGVISRDTQNKYEEMLGRNVRFMMDGYAYTQEYSPGRVNLYLDKDLKIKRYTFG